MPSSECKTRFSLTSEEAWYPVPGFPGYQISSHFRVRSWRNSGVVGLKSKPHLMNVYPLANGYLAFHARRDGRGHTLYLHHVVAEMAVGPRPRGAHVLHRDDNKHNNVPSNLYYGVQMQNTHDAMRNHRIRRGTQCSFAILDDAKVREIHRLVGEGITQRQIGAMFGICQQAVSDIKRGINWKHVSHTTEERKRAAIERLTKGDE